MEVSNRQILPITNQQWNENEPIMISIVVAAFNHQAYIGHAIENFLVQETNFRVEILVNDDASTDNTPQIVKEYAVKHPDLFRNFYQTQNQYSKGEKPWVNVLFPNARGKYIAICEGDDYWTDPFKLQKQVSFLESNKDFSFCYHGFEVLNERDSVFDYTYLLRKNIAPPENTCDLKYFIENKNIKTLTVLFRRSSLNVQQLKKVFAGKLKPSSGDYVLFILLLLNGKGHFLNEAMGVYRLHRGGITNQSARVNNSVIVTLMKLYPEIPPGNNRLLVRSRLMRELKRSLRNMKIGYVTRLASVLIR